MPPQGGMPPQGVPQRPPMQQPPSQGGMPPQGAPQRPPMQQPPPQGGMPGVPPQGGPPPQGSMPPQGGMPPQGVPQRPPMQQPPSQGGMPPQGAPQRPPMQQPPPQGGMPGVPPQGGPPQTQGGVPQRPPMQAPPQGGMAPPQGAPQRPPMQQPPQGSMPPQGGMPQQTPGQQMPPQGGPPQTQGGVPQRPPMQQPPQVGGPGSVPQRPPMPGQIPPQGGPPQAQGGVPQRPPSQVGAPPVGVPPAQQMQPQKGMPGMPPQNVAPQRPPMQMPPQGGMQPKGIQPPGGVPQRPGNAPPPQGGIPGGMPPPQQQQGGISQPPGQGGMLPPQKLPQSGVPSMPQQTGVPPKQGTVPSSVPAGQGGLPTAPMNAGAPPQRPPQTQPPAVRPPQQGVPPGGQPGVQPAGIQRPPAQPQLPSSLPQPPSSLPQPPSSLPTSQPGSAPVSQPPQPQSGVPPTQGGIPRNGLPDNTPPPGSVPSKLPVMPPPSMAPPAGAPKVMPAPGMPAPGMPAPGMPAPGMPAPGMPAPGMPGKGMGVPPTMPGSVPHMPQKAMVPPAAVPRPGMPQHASPEYADVNSGGIPRPPISDMGGQQRAPAPIQTSGPTTTGGYPQATSPTDSNLPTGMGKKDFRPSKTKKNQIDSNSVPQPVSAGSQAVKKRYDTSSTEAPPSADTQFVAIDDKNASPRFMRTSMYSIPYDNTMLQRVGIPWGVSVCPLATPEIGEQKVTVVGSDENGPIRCKRCRAFINSGVQFVDKGRRWNCNMCGVPNDVSQDYAANLDADGVRVDIADRPELRYGSVEWDVQLDETVSFGGNDWEQKSAAPILPMRQLFVLDISRKSGHVILSLIPSLKAALTEMSQKFPDCEVAFLTYSSSVHFYDMTKQSLPVYLASDVDEMFVPLPFNKVCWIKVGEHLDTCLRFVDRLSAMSESINEDGSCLGAAMQAAALVLDSTGGRVMLTYSELPGTGVGSMKPRDDRKLVGTDKEKELYNPQQGFWTDMATNLAKRQICVDVFAFPHGPCELATVGNVASTTGGQVYFSSSFNPARDTEKLRHSIVRNLTRECGYASMFIVRTSPGIRVKSYTGHMFQSHPSVVDMAGVDCDKTLTVELEHESRINEKQVTNSYLQAALLYTRRDGKRRIRVHTLRVQVATAIAQVFKFSDLDATLALTAKRTIKVALQKGLTAANEQIHSGCVDILAGYRKSCAQTSPAGQLVLPEALKLMPIYCLALVKSICFRPGGADIDDRMYQILQLKGMRICDITPYFYPRLYPIHSMPINCGTFDSKRGMFVLPNTETLSSEKVSSSGVYLLHDYPTDCFYVLVGESASIRLQEVLFGVEGGVTPETVRNFPGIIANTQSPDNGGTLERWQMASIIQYLRQARATTEDNVYLIRERSSDPMEGTFFERFVGNQQGPNLVAYTDYLCSLHKSIQNKLRD
eukprot:TRINITY_DN594_c2_g1_i1.p1 TRINITY_DN594_c2_g1~~TRINITY_DN594_c2_g1_i1.p1  ORF type:complete len:1430 (+),score=335.31 TRINITY_DN594_c2_g1_i1:1-4290(+)